MKNILFISCLLITFGLQAQDLKLSKGKKIKIIQVGSNLEVIYVHEDCIECKPRRLTGDLMEVTSDSLKFVAKSQSLYTHEGNGKVRKNYNVVDLKVPVSIAKKDIRLIRKTEWSKWRSGSTIASGLMTITAISTIINSQIVNEKESRSKLEELAVIQAGAAAVFFAISNINPKIKIGTSEDLWKID